MPGESVAALVSVTDWQAVADELAGALRATMLRNPTLNTRDWARASAALERYEVAARGGVTEFRNPSDAGSSTARAESG